MADPQFVVFCSQKGGAGKTTCSMLFADALHRKGKSVLVVDTDVQASAQKWESKCLEGRAAYPVRVEAISNLNQLEFGRWLEKRVDNLDYVVIDTPPSLTNPELRASLFVADHVVIPVVPHGAYIDAMEEMVELLQSVERDRGVPLKIQLLLNKHTGRRASERAIAESIREISPWPVLNASLKDLAAYADAYNYRTSVFDLPSTTREARESIEKVVAEVVGV
jgi:chromosome partitioning protein